MKRYAAIVLIVGLLYCEPSKSQNPQATEGTKATHNDERGTEKSPLVVSARTVKSDAEAAEEKRKDTEQESTDNWTIWLTLAIAICAFLQFLGILGQIYVYLKQTGIMKDTLAAINRQAGHMETQNTTLAYSVKVAELANKRIVEKERARIVVKDEGLKVETGASKLFWYLVATVSINNVGSSRAFITKTEAEFFAVQNLDDIDLGKLESLVFPSDLLDPDKPVSPTLHFFPEKGIGLEQFSAAVNEFEMYLVIVGFIEYQTMGTRWHRNFGYIRKPSNGMYKALAALGGFAGTPEEKLSQGFWGTDHRYPNDEYQIFDNPENQNPN
jgi:hypothetical protein